MGESSMKVHDFKESLAKSYKWSDADWWEPTYRQAFPNFGHMLCVRDDGWAQRGGIDRVVVLTSGKTLAIDEKVREEDWPDILLETWSNRDRKIPGWMQKDLACDFIAYAFIPSQTCYLLPFLTLRRAWLTNGAEWISAAKHNEYGFRFVDSQNKGYVTRSVAVPIKVLMKSINDAMIINW